MDAFHIRPLTEEDINSVIEAAGGVRAHPDADRRSKPGADYLLAESLIELKSLDDEGFSKSERQIKLAQLFDRYAESRPVIVLDQERLPKGAQLEYDRILEGPLKSAIDKAKRQLKQSRAEHADSTSTVLFIVNNGYTALDHEALVRMVAHRVRNDTTAIDNVVVAGCYFYSDTFDNYFLWPIDYVPINLSRPFKSYEKLRTAWSDLAETFMTSIVRGELAPNIIKGPVLDLQFDVHGITYVKPAPPMGEESGFFRGRPRKDSSGFSKCPPIAITWPEVSHAEWRLFKEAIKDEDNMFEEYDEYRTMRVRAAATAAPLKPFVAIAVKLSDWEQWCEEEAVEKTGASIRRYANELFNSSSRSFIISARERLPQSILLSRYVLAVTEEIGQDRANDVSHIYSVRETADGSAVDELLVNARIFHEYAVALASAYAIAEGADCVLWNKDRTYAWM